MWAGKRALPLSTVSAQSRCSDPPLTALREQATASIFSSGSRLTHNLAQAKRVADKTGFLCVDTSDGARTGYLVEFGDSDQISNAMRPKRSTQECIKGEFS
jgi:ABC-type phosphate transport system ATPase subunit